MPQIYLLKGNFVECCDCFTVCPCWVSDIPDEDHCSGLYIWSFTKGSHIGGKDVEGMQIAAATYHAVRAGGQAYFFIDVNSGDPSMADELYQAFFDNTAGHDLKALADLLGDFLGYSHARIVTRFKAKDFEVSIDVDGEQIASAKGTDKLFRDQPAPMTLRDTALNAKLGIGKNAVVVQAMSGLTVDVAALPGGRLNFRGRSGMRSTFQYEFTEAERRKVESKAAKEANVELAINER